MLHRLHALVSFMAAAAAVVVALAALAQPTSTSPLAPPPNGPRRADPMWTAIVDCTAHTRPGERMEHATVVVRNGVIIAVMPGVMEDGKMRPARLPLGPRVIDGRGMHVYAGFIDPYVEIDVPAPKLAPAQMHWNPGVLPQRKATDGGGIDAGTSESLRRMGFTAAAISPRGGIFRGQSAVVSLAQPSEDASVTKPVVYKEGPYTTVGYTGSGGYPGSLMGAIALIRQTFLDADWQSTERSQGRFFEAANALDAVPARRGGANAGLVLFDVSNELDALRSAKIAREFDRNAAILGSGLEFRRLGAIKSDGLPIILPLSFPRTPDVSSIGRIERTELRDLMTWEQAPTNPRRLHAAGLKVALTTSKARDRGAFWENLRKAMRHGLSADAALAMVTTTPAEMLGVAGMMGTVEAGKRANLVVSEGELFTANKKEEGKVRFVLTDGQVHEFSPPKMDLAGEWELTIPGAPEAARKLVIEGEQSVTLHRNDKNVRCQKVEIAGWKISFTFDHEPLDGREGIYLAMAAILPDDAGVPARMEGVLQRGNGERGVWSAVRKKPDLAGTWTALFDDEIPGAGSRSAPAVMVIDAERAVTFADESGGTPLPEAVDFEWRGRVLRYDSKMGDTRTPVEITFDSGAAPTGGKGVVRTAQGPFAFKVQKRSDKPFHGTWRVVAEDGEALDPASKDRVTYEINDGGVTVKHTFAPGEDGKAREPVSIKAENVEIKDRVLTCTVPQEALGGVGARAETLTLVGAEIRGESRAPDGAVLRFSMLRDAEVKAKKDDFDAELVEIAQIPEELGVPFGPYQVIAGTKRPGENGETIIIRGATLWTGADDGIIKDGTLVMRGGKIVYAGPASGAPSPEGAVVIDGAGLHVTAGIIDCHSHVGISRGVNEGGQAVTSEVRIQDVTDPDDVDWYRQLASGVTAANCLHGSANAIGGQSQTIKIRWGTPHPDGMHMENAKPGIKFALGENPTQMNSGRGGGRYPATRMGVEVLIRDRFNAAREYAATRSPRRDLELEALAEVLRGDRLVHCHSYRQDEIVMLARVAQDYGFKIGTYQHILEGYKVAEVVRDFSLGGSGFADWWAYKIEVQDAIPHGLPLMAMVGANVSFNSDSAELVRRMNVEAAKAVKYAGLSETESWNFVTLNPAKQLMVENRIGSLKAGLDADVAVWSGHPLSAFSRCVRTYVDGIEMFSDEADAAHRAFIAKERQRLIQKILNDPKPPKEDASGGDAPKAGAGEGEAEVTDERPRRRRRPPGAESLTDEEVEMIRLMRIELLTSGRVPRDKMPGVCGCGIEHYAD